MRRSARPQASRAAATAATRGSSSTPGEEREQRYPGIVSNIGLEPGDVFRIETGGGGGALPAADRNPARTRADIEDGILTPTKALETYGLDA